MKLTTIQLTDEQKKEIRETLGFNWDTITLDREIPLEELPRIVRADLNVVVAMGKTHTIS
jgi:hypothetical protein